MIVIESQQAFDNIATGDEGYNKYNYSANDNLGRDVTIKPCDVFYYTKALIKNHKDNVLKK